MGVALLDGRFLLSRIRPRALICRQWTPEKRDTGKRTKIMSNVANSFYVNCRNPEYMAAPFRRMKKLIVAPLLLTTVSACIAADLPNVALTPGAINPDVTQANIGSTVCVKGWTKTVRPPASYTNQLKRFQIRQYGYADTDPRDYEEDHLIPLSVGGSPTDPRNLWPEPRNSEWNADRKDELEFALYMAVCHGEIRLEEARSAFATNWINAYNRYTSSRQRYQHGSVD
ncbi:hypothetical protein [Paraburkholderia sediminicola]|uniref:hypothetical protein n=1 Tax=Paraburkholderia sediminicola TaxID=458836 RepID=UPI0038BC9B75